MSDILDVYAALRNKSVSVAGREPRVYGLEEMKNGISTAETPIRLLLPLGTATEGRGFGFVALGRSAGISWMVVDLLLYKPVGQGIGLPETAKALIEYCGNYYDMLRTFRAPTTRTYIENVNIAPNIFEWPRESGKWYSGVECLLEVAEVQGG